MYKVYLADKRVLKQLNNFAVGIRQQIKNALLNLEKEPRPPGSRKLAGKLKGFWRIRIGSYRAIYDIDDKKRVVVVTDIGHRRQIYR